MASIHLRLAAYLENASKRRWQYGAHDCCTFMADWIIASGLPDPMADRRGTYASVGEYRKLIKGEGGLLASCVSRFAAIGLQASEKPKAGEVALVMAPFAIRKSKLLWRATGAVCVSERMRAVVGSSAALTVAPFPIVRAWRLSA